MIRPTPSSRAKTKVLFVGPGRFPEGVWQTRARYILPDLFTPLSETCELHLLTARPPAHARLELEHLQTKFGVIHHCPSRSATTAERVSTLLRSSFLRSTDPAGAWAKRAGATARAIRPDVITHAHGVLLFGYAAVAAARRIGARAVVRVPGDEIGARLEMGVYKEGSGAHRRDLSIQEHAFKQADAIIAMSELERQRIIDAVPEAAIKTQVIVRGVDLERFKPGAGTEPNINRPLRVLFLGRKSLEKGYDLAEQAAVKLQDDSSIEFVFAGTFDQSHTANRRYMGFVDSENLPDLLRSCDVLLLPSRTEGFPQALAEAMATGLACIVSKHLFTTLYADSKDVILVDTEPDAIAAAVKRLSTDIELRTRLCKRARSIAEQHLARDKMQSAYASIIKGPGRSFSAA